MIFPPSSHWWQQFLWGNWNWNC